MTFWNASLYLSFKRSYDTGRGSCFKFIKTGIIGAMDEEVASLKEALTEVTVKTIWWAGTIQGRNRNMKNETISYTHQTKFISYGRADVSSTEAHLACIRILLA